MHKLEIFYIFSRKSTWGKIKKKVTLGDAHSYLEVEFQITRKNDEK
jgi:hypothetical protein